MIFDSHMHTKFSADSKMTAVEAIARAASLNLGVVFTEHFDYGLEIKGKSFTFDAAAYMNEYKNFRGEKVRLGVEVGLRKFARAANEKFIAQAPFDLVIGSIHLVDDLDIYYPEFFADKDKTTAYKKYFRQMADEAAVADFDVLGHIDYICRTAPYSDAEISYVLFDKEIDEVLKYRALGGRFVTLGSDAHRVSAVGNYFPRALDFLRELDLTPVPFCERKLEQL